MKTVCVEGHLQYVENDLSPIETNLQVKLFLGSSFVREPQTIALNENDIQAKYPLKVAGKIAKRRVPSGLSPTLRLNMASFALTKNEFDAPCYVDAGTTHAPLFLVHKEVSEKGTFEHTLPFVMHTADNLIKGKVRLTITKLDLGGLAFEPLSSAGIQSLIGRSVQAQGQRLMEYTESTLKMIEGVPNTIPNTERIQAPYDISESGMEFTGGVPLPVMAYVKYETPKSNSRFWDNALEVVMKRQNKKPAQYLEMGHQHQAQVMAQTCVYVAQYLDYISDEVDRNTRHKAYIGQLKKGYENFGDAGVTWSGDCEDTGLMIGATFDALLEAHLHDAHHKDVLQHIQTKVMPYYTPMMSLDVVHGAKVADQTEQVGAHLNTMIVPVHYFKQCLEQTKAGTAIANKVQWPALEEHKKEDWPTLTGEGTGMYGPLGLLAEQHEVDGIARQRALVYGMPSLAGFKKDLVHEHGAPSNFYMGHLMGMTNFFLKRGVPVGSFVYGVKQPRSRTGWTRGARYTHVVNQKEDVLFMPHPPVPKDVMGLIDDVTQNRVPPNQYILSENAELPTRNAHLDTLSGENFGNYPESETVPVPVYMRPHQLNDELVKRIMGESHYLNGLQRISYELEPITDTIHGYRVLFHMSK